MYYTYLLNIQKWKTLHKELNGFEVFFMQHKTKINGAILTRDCVMTQCIPGQDIVKA